MKSRLAFIVFCMLFGLVAQPLHSQPPALALTEDNTPQQPAAMVVWTEHVDNKVQPTTAVGSSVDIWLEGARKSYLAAQIVVHADGEALTGVNMSASDLSDGAGHLIPAANVTFFRQDFIDFDGVPGAGYGNRPVPEHSPTGDTYIPDPLIPFTDPYSSAPASAPFAVTINQNQPVWVDFEIPANAAAATYSGSITVSAEGQPDVLVPVTLTVWDFELPNMDAITTRFGTYWTAMTRYHRDTYECSGESCWLDDSPYARSIAKRYEELLRDHRLGVKPTYVPYLGRCNPPTDWSQFDAALEPYMDGSYWDDGTPTSFVWAPFTPGQDQACEEAGYTASAQAWAEHLKERGWFTRTYVYAADEPDPSIYEDIALHSQWMQNGDPDWKARIMDTVPPRPDNVDILNPALGIYCVCIRCYDQWYNRDYYGRDEWPDLFDQGIQLWFYESNAQGAPFPTFSTNTLLGNEPSIMMWGAWYENASGFLLWAVFAWTVDDPWGPNIEWGKPGDGVLVYPGHHDGQFAPAGSPAEITIDGPIPSYRLKMVRTGFQDWALFKLADQYGLTDYARQQVAQVYGQMGGCDWAGCPPPENGEFYWLPDPALMDQVRHNIAMAIMGAQADNRAPHTPANPNPADGEADAPLDQALSWQGGDPDGDVVTYTVALGTVNPPPVVTTTLQTSYTPLSGSGSTLYPGLITDTTYYWQITASDGLSLTPGPVWQFSTASASAAYVVYLPIVLKNSDGSTPPANQAPNTPSNPNPADGETDVPTNQTLSWQGDDPDGDAVTYTVAFGTSNPPPTVGQATSSSYDPGALAADTSYYWQITASDGALESAGPLWQFSTAAEPPPPADVVAFPGAQGFGAKASGGRGGQVLKVTTLSADGDTSGSLQWALNQPGPRIIVFDVSGVIEGDVRIPHGDVTIAGQTAPEAGVTIHGHLYTPYGSDVNNIIIRHLRVRPPNPNSEWPSHHHDAIQFSTAHTIILDHVDASHGADEIIDTWGGAYDITLQWSALTYPIYDPDNGWTHNTGIINHRACIDGGDCNADDPLGGRISVHHNLFAHCRNRTPALSTGPADVINNVVYNGREGFVHHNIVGAASTDPDEVGEFNIVGNSYIEGPSISLAPFWFDPENDGSPIPTRYWLWDNAVEDPGVFEGRVDNPFNTPGFDDAYSFYCCGIESGQFDNSAQFDFSDHAGYVPVTVHDAQTAYDAVLQSAGAWPRDVVSGWALADVQSRTGEWDNRRPADWLEGLTPGTPPTDSDDDGMPDDWESAHGLNPNDGSDHDSVMPSGYTAIEEYINELADDLVGG